jgi:hypothetical protein
MCLYPHGKVKINIKIMSPQLQFIRDYIQATIMIPDLDTIINIAIKIREDRASVNNGIYLSRRHPLSAYGLSPTHVLIRVTPDLLNYTPLILKIYPEPGHYCVEIPITENMLISVQGNLSHVQIALALPESAKQTQPNYRLDANRFLQAGILIFGKWLKPTDQSLAASEIDTSWLKYFHFLSILSSPLFNTTPNYILLITNTQLKQRKHRNFPVSFSFFPIIYYTHTSTFLFSLSPHIILTTLQKLTSLVSPSINTPTPFSTAS